MSTDLQITTATVEDDGKRLWLDVTVHNPSDRTLHLYRTLRAIRYDPETHTLLVQMSDRGLEEPHRVGNFIRPRLISIDPGGTTSFRVPLPRVITRVKASPQKLRSPIIESLPAHEAETLEIEIAWGRAPFYDDPRPKAGGPRARLVAWAQGHARLRTPRHSGARPPGQEPTAI